MHTLKQLLEDKSRDPVTVLPQDSVYHALKVMAEKNIGALLVMEGEKLVGIFSERDYARKVILAGHNSKDTRIKEVMTQKVAYVTLQHSIEDCMSLMTLHHFRHLPVLDENLHVQGIVSIGDLVKATIDHQKFIIGELERYISS